MVCSNIIRGIENLPAEVLVRVFSMLPTPTVLSTISRTCRYWRNLSNDKWLWKELLTDINGNNSHYNIPVSLFHNNLPSGFSSLKDLFRVLELYKTFIYESLLHYITSCCPELILEPPLTLRFQERIRGFLSQNISQVHPCDTLLHGHSITDTSGHHFYWCYAVSKDPKSELYKFKRYHLSLNKKNFYLDEPKVDIGLKGEVVTHNNEWICWHVSLYFFENMVVDSLFDVLLAMFMKNVLRYEWEVVEPELDQQYEDHQEQQRAQEVPRKKILRGSLHAKCEEGDDDCNTPPKSVVPKKVRDTKDKRNGKFLKKHLTNCSEYNSKNVWR